MVSSSGRRSQGGELNLAILFKDHLWKEYLEVDVVLNEFEFFSKNLARF